MAEPRGRRLDQPRAKGLSAPKIDADAFGRFSEGIARLLGTGRFLAGQTILVIIWITLNLAAVSLRWDPYPFILLNLAFSTQAAYAAPLILLAQNRQADRDRVQSEEDRSRASSQQAETEYLARELASLRTSIGELATRDFIRSELAKFEDRDDRSGRDRPDREDRAQRSVRTVRAERADRDRPPSG